MSLDLKMVPNKPGIYMFLDNKGKIIYVGKAKSLKKRVSTYFNKTIKDVKTQMLVEHIKNLKFIVTSNEVEAFLLEANLIKTEKPKYNILLKDSSYYPYIKITNEEYPRIVYTRDTSDKLATYFGPFVSAGDIRGILFEVQKIFNLRTCPNVLFKKGKTCINYQTKLCSGPCEGLITKEAYNNHVEEAREFFKGNASFVLTKLQEYMQYYSERLMFEEAAIMRNKINALNHLFSTQTVQLKDFNKNIDVFIFHDIKNIKGISMLFIRSGRLLSNKTVFLDYIITKDSIESYILQFYNTVHLFPDYIIYDTSGIEIDEALLLEGLHRLGGSNVKIKKKGIKKLIDFALRNAQIQTDLYLDNLLKNKNILKRLAQLTNSYIIFLDNEETNNILIEDINTIECIDISHISGSNTVGVSIVWKDGNFCKNNYRRYKIKGFIGRLNDDCSSVYEVMKRKASNIILSKENKADLYIIDGGISQLNAAIKAFKEKGVFGTSFLAIAKRKTHLFDEFDKDDDKIYVRGYKNSINLKKNDPLLLFIQKLRDEAHRYAISYTRQKMVKNIRQSQLLSIRGIGEKRLKKILITFPDIYINKSILPEQLSKSCGISLDIAKEVINCLHNYR